MSEKIIRKSTETKRNIPYIVLTHCDECSHLIRQRICAGFSNLRKVDTEHCVEWYQVTIGNDDKETDICPDCIKKVFDRYLATSRGETDEPISIKHCWVYNHELLEE